MNEPGRAISAEEARQREGLASRLYDVPTSLLRLPGPRRQPGDVVGWILASTGITILAVVVGIIAFTPGAGR